MHPGSCLQSVVQVSYQRDRWRKGLEAILERREGDGFGERFTRRKTCWRESTGDRRSSRRASGARLALEQRPGWSGVDAAEIQHPEDDFGTPAIPRHVILS